MLTPLKYTTTITYLFTWEYKIEGSVLNWCRVEQKVYIAFFPYSRGNIFRPQWTDL